MKSVKLSLGFPLLWVLSMVLELRIISLHDFLIKSGCTHIDGFLYVYRGET